MFHKFIQMHNLFNRIFAVSPKFRMYHLNGKSSANAGTGLAIQHSIMVQFCGFIFYLAMGKLTISSKCHQA